MKLLPALMYGISGELLLRSRQPTLFLCSQFFIGAKMST